jgi:hypothetical protein
MQISFIIDTDTTGSNELTALIALCASLGGRLPNHNPTVAYPVDPELTARQRSWVAQTGEHVDAMPPPPAAESTEGNDQVSPDAGSASEPTTAASTASAPGAAVELDADGIPWDERIHASTKTKTQAGVWTKKRKVDEVLYGQIHAELQELHASEGATSGPLDDTPPPPPSDTSDENAPTDDTDVPPPPAPDVSGDFKEFADLVNKVAPFGLPYVKLAELAVKVTDGLVTKFPDLRDKPDYWSDFYELAKTEAG